MLASKFLFSPPFLHHSEVHIAIPCMDYSYPESSLTCERNERFRNHLVKFFVLLLKFYCWVSDFEIFKGLSLVRHKIKNWRVTFEIHRFIIVNWTQRNFISCSWRNISEIGLLSSLVEWFLFELFIQLFKLFG